MILSGKIAVIYGGGGAIGGAVAKSFAREGAVVCLAGRSLPRLRVTERAIIDAGGRAFSAPVDALDRAAVEQYLAGLVKDHGKLDISFNAISMNNIQGLPLTEMDSYSFSQPVMEAVNSHFITATEAIKHMSNTRSGVILAITANAARKPYPNVGGFGVACAAIEGLCRQLALEAGSRNIRVICLRSAGSPDAPGVDEVFKLHATNAGISRKAFEDEFAESTMLKRLPRLEEIGQAAALMASSMASAITAAVVNITCGELAD